MSLFSTDSLMLSIAFPYLFVTTFLYYKLFKGMSFQRRMRRVLSLLSMIGYLVIMILANLLDGFTGWVGVVVFLFMAIVHANMVDAFIREPSVFDTKPQTDVVFMIYDVVAFMGLYFILA